LQNQRFELDINLGVRFIKRALDFQLVDRDFLLSTSFLFQSIKKYLGSINFGQVKLLIEESFGLSQFSPLFDVVKLFHEDIDPLDQEVRALPDVAPLAVCLSTNQKAADFLYLCGEDVIAIHNTIQLFETFADSCRRSTTSLRVLSVNEALDWIY
jgi:hypothetical protein